MASIVRNSNTDEEDMESLSVPIPLPDYSRNTIASNNIKQTEPKIRIKSQNSLFLLSYSDTDSNPNLETINCFNISIYVDIPTIDYYNDELKHYKLSKLNKKVKLNKLRSSIWNSICSETFWDTVLNSQNPLTCILTINTSGSIRYVQTIKFIIESFYNKIYAKNPKLSMRINLSVSDISLKWFKTFLDDHLLDTSLINFINIDYHRQNNDTKIIKSPFKEYFTKLSNKFTTKKTTVDEIDSLIVITNSTGIRALLTILSDKPLTNFVSVDSINKNNSTLINRDSSSILNFQNNLLTSNKDKSVRIRSLSINRKSATSHVKGTTSASSSDEEEDDSDDSDSDSENVLTNSNSAQLEDKDEGISFYVPTLFSRSSSNADLPAQNDSSQTISNVGAKKKNRFRSLSLMDPMLRKPFSKDELKRDKTFANIYVHDGSFINNGAPSYSKRKYSINNKSLIPPEFYSRISSPPTSNNSSNTSLNSFTKSNSGVKLFEQHLINKSFEDLHNNSNIFNDLINRRKRQQQKQQQQLGLNFNNDNNTTIDLDSEDKLLLGNSKDHQETIGNLNLKLYDDDKNSDNDTKKDNPASKHVKFKKIISFDLYGPNDCDNNDTNWVLGGNNK
ncbi:hypothetical protein KAFR_0B06150 [Kazachstania africana CBS 2517]|uniref:Uncharacterized protein n=1 Tax=Kazachstania africana (strain ATCC 22294 / BCRC 22015 / CBS 2517 / CECT 1963 / NBRC 1671 / NRRL Y-8276) TaxID=1071382 RepID=H2ARB1_KAZAF|nr:hypothetical protein KAFR_0B06150 [Kazachstania africana CBS 2517]CCF56911.1 hypothetical protein KAFR_0B06150 [Kazachstania africana CBS 2517]